MKSEYKKHVKLIRNVFPEDVVRQLGVATLSPEKISELILVLTSSFPTEVVKPFVDNIYHNIELSLPISLDYSSLVAYLLIMQNEKIRSAPIAVDDRTGEVIVFYNADESEYSSTKVTIQCKSCRYIFSILSREDSLAIVSGEFKASDDSLYKTENLMNML